LIVAALLLALSALALTNTPQASADCAFPFLPTTYEDRKDRDLFLDTIELASFNMLFPGDPYFGLADIEVGPRGSRHREPGKVPPVLLKSIGWIESSITQAATDVPFGAIGPALVSFDCGHGVTQVTSGMTIPQGESGRGSPQQALVATHFAYNIARGAAILLGKWNEAPEQRPVAGSDTNGHPGLLENWYYAVWSYNGFTGPGANRSNHPLDPIYGAWPRPAYSCGPTGDGKGHNRGNYPYQELVFGCATNPPIVEGRPLWQATPITLPDLNDATWRNALNLGNFVFPYTRMDIQTPQPFHVDETARPSDVRRRQVMGTPQLDLNKDNVSVGFSPSGGSSVETVQVLNEGSGVLAWYATANVPWLRILPYTGVAVGASLPCERDSPCNRIGELQISVDASRAPTGSRTVKVIVQALGSNQTQEITVNVRQVMRLGVPGITRN
jgi:hypothetical protein